MIDEKLEASQEDEGGFDLAGFMSRAAEGDSSAEVPGSAEEEIPVVEHAEARHEESEGDVPEVAQSSEPEPEATPAEPADNAERSRLGRELKALKTQFQQQNQQMEMLMQILMTQATTQKQPEENGEDDDFIPTTRKGLAEFFRNQMQEEVRQKQTVQQQYARGYLGQLESLASQEDDSPEMLAEINELCTKPGKKFHAYHTGRGDVDARINFFAAKAHLLKQKVAKPEPKKIPLAGTAPKAPLGDGSSGTATTKTVKLQKVDSSARKLAEHFNLDLASMGYEA